MLRKVLIAASMMISLAAHHAAFAGSVEVQSIQITPSEMIIGQRPSVAATIHANSDAGEIVVIASLVRPDNVLRSWNWKNISLKSGDSRTIFLPGGYDTNLAGVYKVDFNVYTKDMRPLGRLSKSFVVADAAHPAVQPAAQAEKKGEVQQSRKKEPESEASGHHFGVGVFGTAMNAAGGATMLLCSSEYACLQGSYSTGNFTTEEGRLLVRLPLASGVTPYIGVGYASVSTERTVDLLFVKTTFRDNGPSGVVGVEIPLGKGLVGYAEASGASIDLKKDVSSGGVSGTAKVDYATVSIGAGIVWYLF